MLNRRDFLKAVSLLALAPTVPIFLARTATASAPGKDARVLVVVQLDGGNDALNTVVPHADPNYPRLRPTLALKQSDLIRLSDGLSLNSALKPLAGLLEAGQLAVVPGVGYPNPSRSHFTGMAVWHTARLDPADHAGYGWLGRALDPASGLSYALHTGVPGALRGRRSRAITMLSVEEMLLPRGTSFQLVDARERGTAWKAVLPADSPLAFVRRQAIDGYATSDRLAALAQGTESRRYPSSELAQRLQLVARLLRANLDARVYYTVQRGYDTHAGQRFTHAGLLGDFARAVEAFFADLSAAGLAERVCLLAFSEFGRTIRENASAGTDHGTAGSVFLAGPGVRGGVCGSFPSLTLLEQGEPRMTTDFRSVYASVLENWLGIASRGVLDSQYERLELFRA